MKFTLKNVVVLCCSVLFVWLVLWSMYFRGSKIIHHKFDEGYEILEIFDLLSKEECEALKHYAEHKGLTDSYIWSYDGNGNAVEDNHRKSKQVWLEGAEHPVVKKLSLWSEKLTGIPCSHQEALQVVRYDIMGKFNDHYDACDYGNEEYCAKMNNNAGQRKATLLVYLNDDIEGGETIFPRVGFTSVPKTGKAILFWNVDEHEQVLWYSRHRGSQVLKGNKWIATVWSHTLPYQRGMKTA